MRQAEFATDRRPCQGTLDDQCSIGLITRNLLLNFDLRERKGERTLNLSLLQQTNGASPAQDAVRPHLSLKPLKLNTIKIKEHRGVNSAHALLTQSDVAVRHHHKAIRHGLGQRSPQNQAKI